jgi:hypothetical protein
MQAIYLVQVAIDGEAEKMISTGRGGGVSRISGEDTAKTKHGTENRIAGIGDWRMVI